MSHTTTKAQFSELGDYTMSIDFCQLFNDQMAPLYRLSLLLTADHGKAEQCFVAGLEDCLQGNPVFREWAESWAKRTIIKNAIRVISPVANDARTASENGLMSLAFEVDAPAAAILRLRPFDRFVLVLTVLEKYSDREAAILLDCRVAEIVEARVQALQQIARSLNSRVGKVVDLAVCREAPQKEAAHGA